MTDLSPLEGGVSAVTLREAKLFLRVDHANDDALVRGLIDTASARVRDAVGFTIKDTSPAPLRLSVLMLVLRAYERGDTAMPLTPVEAWLRPYTAAQASATSPSGGV